MVLGCRVPNAERVIFAAGEKVVLARVQRETRDGVVVAFEVAEVGVVVGREVADGI